MADTQRTRAELIDSFPPNEEGLITDQNMRDFVESVYTIDEIDGKLQGVGGNVASFDGDGQLADGGIPLNAVATTDQLSLKADSANPTLSGVVDFEANTKLRWEDDGTSGFTPVITQAGSNFHFGDDSDPQGVSIDIEEKRVEADNLTIRNLGGGGNQFVIVDNNGNVSSTTSIPQSGVTNLVSALASKAPTSNATFTGITTVQELTTGDLLVPPSMNTVYGDYGSTGSLPGDTYYYSLVAFKDGQYSDRVEFWADYVETAFVIYDIPTPPAGVTYRVLRAADSIDYNAHYDIGAVSGSTFTDDGKPNGGLYLGATYGVQIATATEGQTNTITTNGWVNAKGILAETGTFTSLNPTTMYVSGTTTFAGFTNNFQNLNVQNTFNFSKFLSGSSSNTPMTINNAYNQNGTSASSTDLQINRTHYGIGSGQQNFVDFRVGGSSKFRVDHLGNIYNTAGAAFASSIYIGNNGTTTNTTTPHTIDLGGTVGTNTAGTTGNQKVNLYSAGGTKYGFGISASRLEYQVPTSAVHSFFVNGVERLQINTNGLIVGTDGTSNTFWGTPTMKLRHSSGTRTLLQMYSPNNTYALPFYMDDNGDYNIGGIGGNAVGETYNIGGGNTATSTLYGGKILLQGFTYGNARRVNEIVRRDETAGKTGTPDLTQWQQANQVVTASVDYYGKAFFSGLRVTQATPASSTATGTTGDVSWDANYIYVATGTNTWKRAALTTW